MGSDEERIRPVVWLFAIASLVGFALVLFVVASATDPAHRASDESAGAPAIERGRPSTPSSRARRAFGPDTASHPSPSEAPRFEHATAADTRDPQVEAMERHFGPADGGAIPHFYPTYRTGRIASMTGDVPLPEGTSCEVRVLPVQTDRFSCLIRVMCEGVVLYPDADLFAGYVECSVADGAPIAALDDGYTYADGDPTVAFDARAGRVSVSNDGPGVPRFSATLTLDPDPRHLRSLRGDRRL